jgi:hypothetical protein
MLIDKAFRLELPAQPRLVIDIVFKASARHFQMVSFEVLLAEDTKTPLRRWPRIRDRHLLFGRDRLVFDRNGSALVFVSASGSMVTSPTLKPSL